MRHIAFLLAKNILGVRPKAEGAEPPSVAVPQAAQPVAPTPMSFFIHHRKQCRHGRAWGQIIAHHIAQPRLVQENIDIGT